MIMTDTRTECIVARLRTIADWNAFAKDLLQSYSRWGSLTTNQIIAAERMMDKLPTKEKVDLSRIRQMFDDALANGSAKPVYRAEGLKISEASRYPGVLYVVDLDRDEYQGKVVGGEYIGKPAAYPALQRIAKDPLQAAVDYGRMTGKCACCGRKLTNQLSVELGIGPICRETWGL